jgi:hypothetical protein
VGRWVSVELDYPRSFGTNSGSALSAHGRVRRQRTPSASRMRRTWLRPTSMPISLAASASASNVQYAAFVSSSGWSPPPGSVSSLPGGSLETRAMILERSSSVMRGLRPAPGRSPSPSIPSALKRWRRFLTVFG